MGKTKYKLLSIDERLALYDEYHGVGFGDKEVKLEEMMLRLGVSRATLSRWLQKIKQTLQDKPHEDEYLFLKGKSDYVDYEKNPNGDPVRGWKKYDTDNEKRFTAIKESVVRLMAGIEPIENVPAPEFLSNKLCNVFISNDIHIGALMQAKSTRDRNWDTDVAIDTLRTAIDFLVENSPQADEAIVVDLGDLTEMDDFKNATPHSGNSLDVDGRYSDVITAAMDAMVYMVNSALKKHKLVRFINISGNHDITTGHAIRAYVVAWFRENPRVIVDNGHEDIKYHKHGNTILGFAHGDGLKMQDGGEAMVMHNPDWIESNQNRYFHFGHNHKDKVFDGRLCKSESHRNLAPLNNWASHKGFGRSAGTMKCITYHELAGEYNRGTFNVMMMENEDGN